MITLHCLTMKTRLSLLSSTKKLVSKQQPQESAFLIAELGDIFGNLSKLIKFSTGLKMKVENQRNIQTKKTKTRTMVCLIFRTFVFSIIGNCLLL